MKPAALAAVLFLLLPSLALAWGGDGHQIVCLIAEDRLTPAAKAGIHELLGKDVNISDADVASWADEVRRQRKDSAPWHYVDIPVEFNSFDEGRDGKHGDNVIDRVKHYKEDLEDPKNSKDKPDEALKFLVHFVGDMHQPLHCAERNKDKGGNGRLVFFLDQPRAMSLHAVWDTAILLNHKGTTRNAEYADKLNAAITPEQATEWAKGTPVDWANESHKVAVESAYAGVPVDGTPPKLDQAYVDAAGIVIDKQLQRAGVRLASILNDALR